MSKFPLLPNHIGDALFAGENREHRLWLWRNWRWEHRECEPGLCRCPFALWIGMNPSRAGKDEDDLTIRKNQQFSQQRGFDCMMQMNVGTYISTDPAGLSARGIEVAHRDNLSLIRYFAKRAGLIVVSTGRVPDELNRKALEVFRMLRGEGLKAECLGYTKDGWPKHSSRLGYDTEWMEFRI